MPVVLGVVIGPQVLDLAHVNSFTDFFSDLGYMELGLMEIRRYGASSPQIVRRLNAVYDSLDNVAALSERARIALERRLLQAAVAGYFADPEERAIVERPDRLGLGGA